jgi:hypothetical protein
MLVIPPPPPEVPAQHSDDAPPALLEAKEATGLIDVNHVKVVCVCCIGDVCQEGGGMGISVA